MGLDELSQGRILKRGPDGFVSKPVLVMAGKLPRYAAQ
jgi:hypothetical protein